MRLLRRGMADIAESEIQNYRNILKEDKYREFNRAVGLNAHGIGTGAFVYLRRIFENLIKEAYDSVKSEISLGEEEFRLKRMDEKIKENETAQKIKKFKFDLTEIKEGLKSKGKKNSD